jgi:hypothetical protein
VELVRKAAAVFEHLFDRHGPISGVDIVTENDPERVVEVELAAVDPDGDEDRQSSPWCPSQGATDRRASRAPHRLACDIRAIWA